MATPRFASSLLNLRSALIRRDESGLTDGELLECFVARRDEAAFEALLGRHGPMVLGVCRRVLGNDADAEDAFQAAFLVLVRKAATIRPRGMVGNWLYGVAHSTALKARAMSTKRLDKERHAAARAEPDGAAEIRERLHALLDQELKLLPEIYRAAIVLCDLEGISIKGAAAHLGCPPGTVGTRLARGRRLLARRLSRHGLAMGGGIAAGVLAEDFAAAAVPPALLDSTAQAAKLFAASGALAASAVPAKVAALTEGMLRTMLLTKLKTVTAIILALAATAVGTGLSAFHGPAAQPPVPPAKQADSAKAPPKPAVKPVEDRKADPQPADLSVRGSGKAATKELPLSNFTNIEVSRSFQLEVTRAEAFRVAVTTDDNLLPYVQAIQDGTTVRIAIDPKVRSFWATSLKATVAMPAVERLRVASGGRATISGFKSAKPFSANVAYSAVLTGDVEAPSVQLDVADGGRVMLKGSTRELKVVASRACRLSLAEFAADRADVTLRDGSTAAVRVKEKLEYNINRACRLEYLGNPATTTGTTLDASVAAPVTIASRETDGERQQAGDRHHHHKETGPAPPALDVGTKVPDFTLRDLTGREVKFSELQKEARETAKGVVVLSFWCSYCPSCRRVEPRLDKLAKEYKGRALVVALDANFGDTAENARAALAKGGLSFPVFLNADGSAADLFGTKVTTTTVVIDAAGVVRYCGRFSDGDQQAYAEDALKAVLAGKEVAIKTTPHDGCGILRK